MNERVVYNSRFSHHFASGSASAKVSRVIFLSVLSQYQLKCVHNLTVSTMHCSKHYIVDEWISSNTAHIFFFLTKILD